MFVYQRVSFDISWYHMMFWWDLSPQPRSLALVWLGVHSVHWFAANWSEESLGDSCWCRRAPDSPSDDSNGKPKSIKCATKFTKKWCYQMVQNKPNDRLIIWCSALIHVYVTKSGLWVMWTAFRSRELFDITCISLKMHRIWLPFHFPTVPGPLVHRFGMIWAEW